MNLPLTWQRRLKLREPEIIALVMVNPHGIDPTVPVRDFALSPGTIRLATEPASVTAGSMTLPFAPWVTEWPRFEERYAPQDRRHEIAETTVKVMSGAGLAGTLMDAGGGQSATAQIALWSPRMSIDRALLMMAGPVRGVPSISERDGGVEFAVTDGDPDRVVEFPAGPITLAEFPGAPAHVAGVRERQWIFGGYPYQVGCPQIDADRLLYYVHDGEAQRGPDRVWNNGVELELRPAVVTVETAASGLPVTALRFDAPPLTPDGLLPSVSCAGGVGVEERHPGLFLLETVGGFKVSARARQALAQSPIAFDLLLNARGDVRRIVADQIIPQTDLVLFMRHGAVDALPTAAAPAGMRLGIGHGLIYRLEQQAAETPLSSVHNAFEINCGRNAGARSGSLLTIRRDADHGSEQVRALLARSQRAFGRRAITWPALDLAIMRDSLGVAVACPSGELLGDALARAHAFPWRPHIYRASWLEGLAVELGQRVYLTDADEGLDDAPMTITGRTVRPTGVDLTFAAQSEPARTLTTQRKVYASA